MTIAGWGNFPRIDGDLYQLAEPRAVPDSYADRSVIAHGMGRSYGDAGLGVERTASTLRMNRLISLNRESGELTAEAGAVLADIIRIMLPYGFFPAVIPGTQFVTLGGMVAANVHGKNHHAGGGFGHHVTKIKLAGPGGEIFTCSPSENPDLFHATLGGMGLTGIILEVTIKLVPVETSYIREDTKIAPNLDAAMDIFEHSQDWLYTVAWIDGLAKGNSLGRCLIYCGRHAKLDELSEKQRRHPYDSPAMLPLAVPFNMPNFTLNRFTVRAFNEAYYLNGLRKKGPGIAGWYPFFFPLDAIAKWNRIYGKRGFIQYQCVIPKAKSRAAVGEILDIIDKKGNPSFLAVLKLLGPDDMGLMTFPMEGYTLAIDFPVNAKTMAVAQELDRVVTENGGRLYLAKDARQSRDTVEAGYAATIGKFRDFRKSFGADKYFRSLQSERLGL